MISYTTRLQEVVRPAAGDRPLQLGAGQSAAACAVGPSGCFHKSEDPSKGLQGSFKGFRCFKASKLQELPGLGVCIQGPIL